ncbi:MAG: cell division protein FtsL [Acidiferrobacteraceae bacterium]|jgi:cell division protein FtsL
MNRRVVILAACLTVTAITVIELRHRSRDQFAELQQLLAQRDALNTEWGRLLLEEGAWSQHRRVEAIARTRLGMTTPDSKQAVVLDLRAGGDKP